MKVTMMIADAAQAVGGKLYILGGGWSVIGPDPAPFAIAIKIEVPWGEANRPHTLTLSLLDADARPVSVPTPQGEQPLQIKQEFEVGRPPGLPAGTPLDAVLALNFLPIPLAPGGRYVWRLAINDDTKEEVAFLTRPKRTPVSLP